MIGFISAILSAIRMIVTYAIHANIEIAGRFPCKNRYCAKTYADI